jgi:Putative zinc dependent peptidase (DUF5700)
MHLPGKLGAKVLLPITFFLVFQLLDGTAAAQGAPDFSQAEAMLQLLRSCHEKTVPAGAIDGVLSLPGTGLVVQQQNISRRVTKQQYREVLQAACAGKVAEVKPAEAGARAEKGVAGLTQDVGPSLVWGRDHIALLESQLAELRRNQAIGDAIPLARKYLPEQVPLAPKLYIVMGGRAGAAAIDEQLYFDVLISVWRNSHGTAAAVSPAGVVEFFAHETHHLGYGQILDRKRDSLALTPAEAQAWGFLVATMMEGSATLLINGHEKLDDLEKQPDVRPYLAKVPKLLPEMQDILRDALKGPIPDESYAEASSAFFDMGYHAAGAVLLAAIEKKRGLGGVMDVMADPRRLLAAYNECASESTVAFKFDPALAEQMAHIGESKPR